MAEARDILEVKDYKVWLYRNSYIQICPHATRNCIYNHTKSHCRINYQNPKLWGHSEPILLQGCSISLLISIYGDFLTQSSYALESGVDGSETWMVLYIRLI